MKHTMLPPSAGPRGVGHRPWREVLAEREEPVQPDARGELGSLARIYGNAERIDRRRSEAARSEMSQGEPLDDEAEEEDDELVEEGDFAWEEEFAKVEALDEDERSVSRSTAPSMKDMQGTFRIPLGGRPDAGSVPQSTSSSMKDMQGTRTAASGGRRDAVKGKEPRRLPPGREQSKRVPNRPTCDQCKALNFRGCDGVRPRCGTCAMHEESCTYTGQPVDRTLLAGYSAPQYPGGKASYGKRLPKGASCGQCRKQGRKCDAVKPICGPCAQFKQTCTYTDKLAATEPAVPTAEHHRNPPPGSEASNESSMNYGLKAIQDYLNQGGTPPRSVASSIASETSGTTAPTSVGRRGLPSLNVSRAEEDTIAREQDPQNPRSAFTGELLYLHEVPRGSGTRRRDSALSSVTAASEQTSFGAYSETDRASRRTPSASSAGGRPSMRQSFDSTISDTLSELHADPGMEYVFDEEGHLQYDSDGEPIQVPRDNPRDQQRLPGRGRGR
ncbi:hypothetical protein PMZ80_009030 [Knufia obscura]|nr:hypothetical protein PMZ80_009030 [Knufia obscura]